MTHISSCFAAKVRLFFNARIWETSWFIVLILGILYVSTSLIRFYYSTFLPGPVVMGDELIYRTAAESFFRFGDFYKLSYLGYSQVMGNVLYQALISYSFYFGQSFYAVAKGINVCIITTAIFPTFLLTKCFSSMKMSLLSSLMVIFLPTNLYANYLMPENLFFPIFLFSLLFVFKALYGNRAQDAISSGLCVALLFLTKPHAIALIISFIILSVIILLCGKYFLESLMLTLRSSVIIITSTIIFYVLAVLLLKKHIYLSELLGEMYSNVGWEIVTNDKEIMASLKDFLRMFIAHLTGFLFLYGVPVVVTAVSTVRAFKEKDFKSFLFLLWGSIAFLAFFAMTLKFSFDIKEAEHMTRLHGRYYFYVFPFFLIVLITFLKKMTWSRWSAGTFATTSIFVAFGMLTVFPSFFPSWPMYCDLPDWVWLNTFSRSYRAIIDLQWWSWGDANSLEMTSTLLMAVILLLGFYYAISKCRSLLPYVLFFLGFAIVANIFELRTQIGFSSLIWQKIKSPLSLIESTITDRKEPVLLIGTPEGMRMHFAFWLPYETLHVAVLAPEASISNEIMPPGIKWIVLLDRYQVNVSMELVRSEGLLHIYTLPRAEESGSF